MQPPTVDNRRRRTPSASSSAVASSVSGSPAPMTIPGTVQPSLESSYLGGSSASAVSMSIGSLIEPSDRRSTYHSPLHSWNEPYSVPNSVALASYTPELACGGLSSSETSPMYSPEGGYSPNHDVAPLGASQPCFPRYDKPTVTYASDFSAPPASASLSVVEGWPGNAEYSHHPEGLGIGIGGHHSSPVGTSFLWLKVVSLDMSADEINGRSDYAKCRRKRGILIWKSAASGASLCQRAGRWKPGELGRRHTSALRRMLLGKVRYHLSNSTSADLHACERSGIPQYDRFGFGGAVFVEVAGKVTFNVLVCVRIRALRNGKEELDLYSFGLCLLVNSWSPRQSQTRQSLRLFKAYFFSNTFPYTALVASAYTIPRNSGQCLAA